MSSYTHSALPKNPIAENYIMIKFLYPIAFILLLSFVSCAGLPEAVETVYSPKLEEAVETVYGPKLEETIENPEPPVLIMGRGLVNGEQLSLFLERNNPQIDSGYVLTLAEIYVQEAAFEGVNHDIAFAQMCLETGFLKFGGLVQPEWNNFCGLGAIGPQQPGLIFPDPRTGVRAHIQHLKAYASNEPIKGELVDPRYRYVRLGSSPSIEGLTGTWAADKLYSDKIKDILRRLYDFSF